MTMMIRKKALLRIAIRFLPDNCRHIHAQKIRSFSIIDVIGHFVNAASFWTSGPIATAGLKKLDISTFSDEFLTEVSHLP